MDREIFSPQVSEKNSFDFLRLLFAFSVFISHFGKLTHTKIYFPISAPMGVAGFFIISGFLVTQSYYRSSGIWNYCIKRIRRIVPAYLLIVIACAFGFSLISTLPLEEYFTSSTFYRYLIANMGFMNFIQPDLPGVFTKNVEPHVNGSLWTIKVELMVYAFIPIMAFFLRRKPVFVLTGLYILSFFVCYLFDHSGKAIFGILKQIQFVVSGVLVLFYFDFFKNKLKILLPIAIAVVLSRYFVHYLLINFLFPVAFAILIISFAYYVKQLAVISRYGDFSYGIYLFHYPVIQLCVHFGGTKIHPALLFIICFVPIVLLSVLSWHLLEKRMLKRRTR